MDEFYGVLPGTGNAFCGLLEAVDEFASPEYQEKVWVRGEGDEVTSYTEAMGAVLEDFGIFDFAGATGVALGISAHAREALEAFGNALKEFHSRVDCTKKDGEIIASSSWSNIVHLACLARDACEESRRLHCSEN